MHRNFVSWSFLLLILSTNLLAGALFKPAKTYLSGGANADAVVVADMNGDGKLDLVVSNYSSCSGCSSALVAVLLGNGDGTFQAAQTYYTGGNGAGGLAVADLNGDGRLDVIVANNCAVGKSCDGTSDAGSIAVLMGNGDGTFQAARVYSAGVLYPTYLVLGDFNRDGHLDVAVEDCGSCGGQDIAVLLGNGDGSFQSAQLYDSGGEPQGIAAGDIDGDGNLDIVVGFETAFGGPNGSSAVLFGKGDGTFLAPQILSPAGLSPALTDINGDGKLDLVVVTPCGNAKCNKSGVGVLLGNGDGSFQPLQNYNSGGYAAAFVATGDVNRDGKVDVFVANFAEPTKVGTLLGDGDGALSPVQLSTSGTGNPFSLAVADVNGDGKPDLIVAINNFNNELNLGGIGVLLNNTFWTSTTTLASRPNPSVVGQAVTFTATVVSEGSIESTGKVVFKNGGTQIGSATLSGGVATLTKKNLPIGSLSITATYKGDTQSAMSTSPVLIQVVNPASKP
jgi:hypothetical protein